MRGLVVRLGDGFAQIKIDDAKVAPARRRSSARWSRTWSIAVLRDSNSAKAFPAPSAADW